MSTYRAFSTATLRAILSSNRIRQHNRRMTEIEAAIVAVLAARGVTDGE